MRCLDFTARARQSCGCRKSRRTWAHGAICTTNIAVIFWDAIRSRWFRARLRRAPRPGRLRRTNASRNKLSIRLSHRFNMQTEIKVPALGESITEVDIGQWLKKEGDAVAKDENLVSLESEKATVDLPAPSAGVLAKILKPKGQVANVGEVIAVIESNGAPTAASAKKEAPKPAPTPDAKTEPRVMP